MPQRLHLVFGGELVSPERTCSRMSRPSTWSASFPTTSPPYLAWKAEAQRTVDNAHMRYFIANLHRLRQESAKGSETEPMTA